MNGVLGRAQNVSGTMQLHGLDFAGADAIWDGFTITREDVRQRYGEPRWVTFGFLRNELVVLVHTDRDGDMHIISLRRADKYEARYYAETSAKHHH